MTGNRPAVNAFWHGPPMSAFTAACLKSFAVVGRRVRLFLYDLSLAPDGLEGVERVDANEVMPVELAKAYRREGSYALAADRFRLELMRRSLGLYVDSDLYCLRDPDDGADYVMGRQDDLWIANGVLKLPADSPILDELLALFEPGAALPPWFRGRRRIFAMARRAAGLRSEIEDWPWATSGPTGLTHLAHKYGVFDLASPPTRFYPLPSSAAVSLCEAGFEVAPYIRPESEMVHLWNERLRRLPPEAVQPGSPLDRLMRTGRLVE